MLVDDVDYPRFDPTHTPHRVLGSQHPARAVCRAGDRRRPAGPVALYAPMPKASFRNVMGDGRPDRVMTSMIERECCGSVASLIRMSARSAREVARPGRRRGEHVQAWRADRVPVGFAGHGGDVVSGGQCLPDDPAAGGAVGPEHGKVHDHSILTATGGIDAGRPHQRPKPAQQQISETMQLKVTDILRCGERRAHGLRSTCRGAADLTVRARHRAFPGLEAGTHRT